MGTDAGGGGEEHFGEARAACSSQQGRSRDQVSKERDQSDMRSLHGMDWVLHRYLDSGSQFV